MINIRPFVSFDTLGNPLTQTLLVNACIGTRHNERVDSFSRYRVRDARGQRCSHGRVLDQHMIEF